MIAPPKLFDGDALFVPAGFGSMAAKAFSKRLVVISFSSQPGEDWVEVAKPRGRVSGLELATFQAHGPKEFRGEPRILNLWFNVGFINYKEAAIELESWARGIKKPWGFYRTDGTWVDGSTLFMNPVQRDGGQLVVTMNIERHVPLFRVPLAKVHNA